MPSDLIRAAQAYRKHTEELAQKAAPQLTDAERLDYFYSFPVFDPGNTGYSRNALVRYRDRLYENLLQGNRLSPDEYPFAWRWIDPEATNMEAL